MRRFLLAWFGLGVVATAGGIAAVWIVDRWTQRRALDVFGPVDPCAWTGPGWQR